MYNFIDFPAEIAAPFIEKTRADYINKELRKRRSTSNSHRMENQLCYKKPCGVVRPVYDPYRPSYPEGAQPGTCTIEAVKEYYPNDTEGYKYYCYNFKPLNVN